MQSHHHLSIAKISKMFDTAELSVSSYDTAWVAMVPSPSAGPELNHPTFPQCLNWILENQHPDGSLGLPRPRTHHPLLVKDSLSSTLACLLALHKWKLGDLLVKRGVYIIYMNVYVYVYTYTIFIFSRPHCSLLLSLDFIGLNYMAASDKNQYSPIGFDIIFPGMINAAEYSGLILPLDPSYVDVMLRKRDLEVMLTIMTMFIHLFQYAVILWPYLCSHFVGKMLNILGSFEGKRGHLAYFAEGLGDSYDWKEAMIQQRRNGSLFNSP